MNARVRAWSWFIIPSWISIACAISPRTVEELPDETGTEQTGGVGGKPSTAAGDAFNKGGGGPSPAGTGPMIPNPGPGLGYAGSPNGDCIVGVDPNWIAPTGDEPPSADTAGAGGQPDCYPGSCGPMTVASTHANIIAAYLNSGAIYWTDGYGSGVGKVVLATGRVTHLACGLTDASLVIADDENVYFTQSSRNGDYVSRVPVNGGVITPTIGGLGGISDIAMDENDVYLSGANGMLAFSKATLELQVIPSKIEDPVSHIAADATNIYWGGLDGVYRTPKVGKTSAAPGATLLARGPAGVFGLAIDDEYIYWDDSLGIERVRKDIPGAADTIPELLAIDGYGVRGLFLDESFVYWASTGGLIVKLAKGGGTPTLVAASVRAAPVLVGVDDKYVYWFEEMSILKVAK